MDKLPGEQSVTATILVRHWLIPITAASASLPLGSERFAAGVMRATGPGAVVENVH